MFCLSVKLVKTLGSPLLSALCPPWLQNLPWVCQLFLLCEFAIPWKNFVFLSLLWAIDTWISASRISLLLLPSVPALISDLTFYFSSADWALFSVSYSSSNESLRTLLFLASTLPKTYNLGSCVVYNYSTILQFFLWNRPLVTTCSQIWNGKDSPPSSHSLRAKVYNLRWPLEKLLVSQP